MYSITVIPSTVKSLTSPITTFLDGIPDPLDRLRHLRQIQAALVEVIAEQQRRSVEQLRDLDRWGPTAVALTRDINLGTAIPGDHSHLPDVSHLLEQPPTGTGGDGMGVDPVVTGHAQQ